MGRVAEVIAVEEDGNVKADMGGGDAVIADNFADPGEDSPPLPGDRVALVDGSESGTQQATGYDDDTERKAAPGEKRTFARDSGGELVAEIWLKGDGTIVVVNIASGSQVELTATALECSHEVAAQAATPATRVGLSTHLIPSPLGPLGPPIPGT